MCLGVERHLASGHEINMLQYGLQLIMARYTRIITCRPCCNLYILAREVKTASDSETNNSATQRAYVEDKRQHIIVRVAYTTSRKGRRPSGYSSQQSRSPVTE